MAKDEYPCVYVVDSNAARPPIPPRLSQGHRRMGMAQTLLFLLVAVALCGMAIEACFIYHLYHPEPAASGSSSKIISDKEATAPTKRPGYDILPSKPVAHLTDGNDVVHGRGVMAWSMIADPILFEMTYKDRRLIIQKEGYYYVYSKVFFSDNGMFNHFVDMLTEKYPGKSITLLQSRRVSSKPSKTQKSNSYLGGVFHLYKDAALSVRVSNTTQVMRHHAYENFFGAYMI